MTQLSGWVVYFWFCTMSWVLGTQHLLLPIIHMGSRYKKNVSTSTNHLCHCLLIALL
ncbi:hypothetical protein Hanom_Chr07g00667401 [Helianthus anomalus]